MDADSDNGEHVGHHSVAAFGSGSGSGMEFALPSVLGFSALAATSGLASPAAPASLSRPLLV